MIDALFLLLESHVLKFCTALRAIVAKVNHIKKMAKNSYKKHVVLTRV